MRVTRRIAAWTGGVLLSVAATACSLPGPPTLALESSAALADGEQALVKGTGFTAGQELTVYQCAADLVGFVDCDLDTATPIEVGPDGSFVASPTVFAVLGGWGRTDVDCREPGSCVLATAVGFDFADRPPVTVPLVFDADAPLLPAPSIVSPAVGLTDGQTVRVDGAGFVRTGGKRLRGAEPLRIYQCAQGEFGPSGSCRAAATLRLDVDAGGSFAAEVPVSAVVVTRYGETADCRTREEPCYLIATRSPHVDDGADVVARLDLDFDADAPLLPLPMPQLAVSPRGGLHDVGSVAADGAGFAPATQVELRVCRADDPWVCDPRVRALPSTALDGTFSTQVTVWSSFTRWGGEHVDCRAEPGCIVVATPGGSSDNVTVPIEFGPPDAGRGRYLDPVFEDVDYDVVYRDTVDNRGRPIQLKMDIFRPAGDTVTNRPAVVWMHGGFFTGGDKSLMHPDAMASAQRGYVGISLQYRLFSGSGVWHDGYLGSLDAYDDATAGVEWLQAHAAEYGINPDAIVAGGFSAGAVTALNLAYLPGQRGPAEPLVAAVVSRGGILYTPPTRGGPPVIAFHGSADDVTIFENLGDICDLAGAVDVACEMVVYDGLTHVGGELDDVQRRTGDFLAEHVLGPLGYLADQQV